MSRRQTSGELDGMPIDPAAVAANGAEGIPSIACSDAMALSAATLLVQIEPIRQWVCQPRTAPYGLVGQQIEPESAVKLKPSFVHQQARRDTDARRNSVTEKVLHRRCRYVDIRTGEGWSFGRVLLERPIEPIDRRHEGGGTGAAAQTWRAIFKLASP